MIKSALKPMSVIKVVGYNEATRKTKKEFLGDLASRKQHSDNLIRELQADRLAGRCVW